MFYVWINDMQLYMQTAERYRHFGRNECYWLQILLCMVKNHSRYVHIVDQYCIQVVVYIDCNCLENQIYVMYT